MGTYERRIQAPEKSLSADWVPEEGELFKNGANLYMGDNTTASNALTPINGGGSAQAPVGLPYTFSTETSDSGIRDGQVRIETVNPNGATTMWIAHTDDSTQDRGAVLNTLSAGGLVYINTAGEDGVVGVFRVTAMVDSGTYYTLTVSNFSGALPNDGAAVRVTIAPVEVTGVKKWRGIVSWVSGTNWSLVSLENSLGETPSISDDGNGDGSGCNLTTNGLFTAQKTLVFSGAAGFDTNTDNAPTFASRTNTNVVKIASFGGVDAPLSGCPVEILVFP